MPKSYIANTSAIQVFSLICILHSLIQQWLKLGKTWRIKYKHSRQNKKSQKAAHTNEENPTMGTY